MLIKTLNKFPRKTKEVKNFWIPMSDGIKLAARMFLPVDAERNPVPALLEYLPYRKTDGTHLRDALTHPYLAGHGYASVRVDMRGNGDSEGLMQDEYTRQEQDDALEVIAWLAAQKWCDGTVGMFGISWGGFNALQVAQRQPPALKAIVTLCATDDRYEDDIHYKGGTLLNENLGRAATMLAYSSRPPDPQIVGPRWKKIWAERLKHQPFLIIPWLQHPHRDDYWKHGSVCENFGAITAATLVVGGWNDAYSNAVPRLMKGLRCPRKAIIGPWVHKYPHLAEPGPKIGFLQEMLRWWDFYLKNIDTKVTAEPDYRIYVMEPWRRGSLPTEIKGRWIAENYWGPGATENKTWYLTDKGIAGEKGVERALEITSSQTTGFDGGEYCINGSGPEFPGDQARDDSQSITFESPATLIDMDIVGQPVVELAFSVDKPVAHICVRLNDVWPSGEVNRITYHLQNLTQRISRESPMPLEPGQRYLMKIKLDDIAYKLPRGHRLRVAISTSYFPMMWPAPEPVKLTVYAGVSELHLPLRKNSGPEKPANFAKAQAALPLEIKYLTKASNLREVKLNPKTGETRLEIIDDFGTQVIKSLKLTLWSRAREHYSILPDDPLSAKMETHRSEGAKRGRWAVHTETYGRLTTTKTHWIVWGKIEAFEGKKRLFVKEFNEKIPRLLQ